MAPVSVSEAIWPARVSGMEWVLQAVPVSVSPAM